MRRKSHSITASAVIAFAGLAAFAPTAHASWLGIEDISISAIQYVAAAISNIALTLASYWLIITGALFSVSIDLTLNIKDFVDKTQGVYLVWQTIRDISGMFIIFMLLYTSFRLILSRDSGGGINSVGNLIKNIVIAGILINFSFFITSLLIDASNIVSLALYKGIVSAPLDTQLDVNILSNNVLNGKDVGLSDIFMQHLAPQTISNPANLKLGDSAAGAPAPLKIVVQGVVGVIIMFTVGMSFLLASAAFAARLVILIVLLAFSPIWFASWVIPELQGKAKEFTSLLKGQLIFMPVYLLLLYASMLIITKSTVFTNPASTSTGSANAWILGYIVLAVNDFFIIFLLNLPLVIAFSYAGTSAKWLEGGMKRLGAANVWKSVGGFAGRNTIGHIAYNTDEALAKTRLGNTALGRDFRFATTGALARAKMGGDRNYEDVRTIHADVVRRAAANKRLRALNGLIAKGETDPSKYHDEIDPMPPMERLELSPEIWKNKEFLKQIDASDYKAYQASKRVEDNDVVKNEVKQNRRAALRDALGKGQNDVVEHMLEEMDGHELMKQVGKPFEKDGKETEAFKDPDFIKNLTQAHLRAFEDENLDDERKTHIGREIYNWKKNYNKNHPAFGFVTRKDNESWLPEGLRGSDKSGDRSGTDDGPRIISGSKYGPVR